MPDPAMMSKFDLNSIILFSKAQSASRVARTRSNREGFVSRSDVTALTTVFAQWIREERLATKNVYTFLLSYLPTLNF